MGFFQKRINRIVDKYKEKNIILLSKKANFLGIESLKKDQVRGNGLLLLTEKELIFRRLRIVKNGKKRLVH
jgi:hypothetical protein